MLLCTGTFEDFAFMVKECFVVVVNISECITHKFCV